MTQPYDDARYLAWVGEFNHLAQEFLDTEGNTPETLRAELETCIDNADLDPVGDGIVRKPKKP